jgi:pimeloyl-ACP methyl ester carboxylesterase
MPYIMSQVPHHIIYIPGIGDHKTYGQNIGIQIWRIFGFAPHYFALGWATKDGFEAKLNRLLAEVDSLAQDGNKVSLVGVSAGASAVLAAYAKRPGLSRIVCICGKIQNPQTVKPATYLNNPDFKESMSRVDSSLKQLKQQGLLKNIMSIHPLRDKTVPLADTKIAGGVEKTVPGWSHSTGILVGVIIGAPIIARFLHAAKEL